MTFFSFPSRIASQADPQSISQLKNTICVGPKGSRHLEFIFQFDANKSGAFSAFLQKTVAANLAKNFCLCSP